MHICLAAVADLGSHDIKTQVLKSGKLQMFLAKPNKQNHHQEKQPAIESSCTQYVGLATSCIWPSVQEFNPLFTSDCCHKVTYHKE